MNIIGENKYIHVKIVNEYGKNMPDATGIAENMLKKAASMAICKINIDFDYCLGLKAMLRKFMHDKPSNFDPRVYMGEGRDALKYVFKHKVT